VVEGEMLRIRVISVPVARAQLGRKAQGGDLHWHGFSPYSHRLFLCLLHFRFLVGTALSHATLMVTLLLIATYAWTNERTSSSY